MMTKTIFRIVLGLTLCAAAAPGLSAMQTINSVTCDRGCARHLELANGESVTISLSGQGLAGLVSGVVTDWSGRPIQGVSVALGDLPSAVRTRSLTMTRDVTLTAQGVPALTDLQLRFTTSRRGSVTAPLDLSVAAVPTVAKAVAPRDRSVPPSRDPKAIGAAPTVTAAVPSSRTLLGDGRSRTVILNGSNLDQVTGAYVERNGTRIHAVRTELRPTTDPGRREVRLRATSSAGPPWNVPLDLVLVASFGFAARTPLQMVLRAPPDIKLTISCFFDSRGLPFAYALIRNEGSETAVFQPNEMIARFSRPGFRYEYKAGPTATHIRPGGQKSLGSHGLGGPYPAGTVITVRWVVNPRGHVFESSGSGIRSNTADCRYTY